MDNAPNYIVWCVIQKEKRYEIFFSEERLLLVLKINDFLTKPQYMFYYLISRYDKNGLVYDSNASLLAIIWGTWDDFWCNTSISGANNAGRAKNPPYIRRCLWLLLFGFCFYFTLINVLELINNYYQYPVDYSVTVQHKDLVSIIILQKKIHFDLTLLLKINFTKFFFSFSD